MSTAKPNIDDVPQEETGAEPFLFKSKDVCEMDNLTDHDNSMNARPPTQPKPNGSDSQQVEEEVPEPESNFRKESNSSPIVSIVEESERIACAVTADLGISDETGPQEAPVSVPTSVQFVETFAEDNLNLEVVNKNTSEELSSSKEQDYSETNLNHEETVPDDDDNDSDSDDEPLSSKLRLRRDIFEDDEDNAAEHVQKNPKETIKKRKELELELQNIRSESQRLARESEVSLPYHKPQIKSLVDFLNRKSASKSSLNTPKFVKSSLCSKLLSSEKSEEIETSNLSRKPDLRTSQLSDFKKKILQDKSVATVTPKLSAQTEIELDLNETPKGLNTLMTRFFKHNQRRPEPTIQDIKMHLVCKDVDKDGNEHLKAQEITVKLEPKDTGTPLNTEKFSAYKGQLLSTITKKKLEKQESLIAAHELDNEEGFEEEEEEDDEDESGSDSDVNGSEVECNDSDLEGSVNLDKEVKRVELNTSEHVSDLILDDTDAAVDGNVGLDKETPVEGPIQDSLKLFLEDSEMPDSKLEESNKETEGQLVLEDSQVPDQNTDCKKPEDDMDSSFELMGSVFPAQQPGGGLKYGRYVGSDDEASSQKTPVRCNTIFARKSFDYDSETLSQSDSPVFSIPRLPAIFNKGEVTDSQGLNELLPLCSGKFLARVPSRDFFQKPGHSLKKTLFSGSDDSHSQNFDELISVCSGKFPDSSKRNSSNSYLNTSSDEFNTPLASKEIAMEKVLSSNKSLKLDAEEFQENFETKQPLNKNDSGDDDDDDVIQLSKKVASKRKVKLNFESDNDESDADDEQKEANSSDENEEEDEGKTSDPKDRTEGIDDEKEEHLEQKEPVKVTDFFDEEAELSGSDVGSDDEVEDNEDEQIFDDTVPSDEEMTEEELRNQIGKVHLKRMMDDDKRELRLFQEVYLEDGDLHTDGDGRERKFRWKNSSYDENDNQGEGGEGSGDELEGNVVENEKWRVQRLEREKWVQEQEALHSIENWTGFKLVKRTKPTSASQASVNLKYNSPLAVTNLPKSFLARNKEFCNQLAEKFQKQESDHVGKRSTKNFVFVSKSPTKTVKRAAEQVTVKEAKIRKLTTSNFKTTVKKSVFNFI